MKSRLQKSLVTFAHPFRLDSVELDLPAGGYTIETEEEALEGLTFLAYRRIATTLIVYAPRHNPGPTRYYTIDPAELGAAQARDLALGPASDPAADQPAADRPAQAAPLSTPKLQRDPPYPNAPHSARIKSRAPDFKPLRGVPAGAGRGRVGRPSGR
jgi:hypothetical protein